MNENTHKPLYPNGFPHRGEIYYITDSSTSVPVGSEIRSKRHAVIVSNDDMNKKSNVVLVVYITTKNKSASRFHVDLSTRNTHRVALCEQVTAVDKSRIKEYKGHTAPHHIENINRAVSYVLDLQH